LIRKNTNPLVIQNLFAHSDMSITNIYAGTEEAQMLEAVKRLDIAGRPRISTSEINV